MKTSKTLRNINVDKVWKKECSVLQTKGVVCDMYSVNRGVWDIMSSHEGQHIILGI